MRRLFPLSTRVHNFPSMGLIILVYLAISALSGIAFATIAAIPLLGPILSLASQMANLYCLGGIVVTVMFYYNLVG